MKLVVAAIALLLSTAVARATDKPNILFVFADDHAYDTIAALGNDEIKTPNLDRLVARGTTFTHAYNMGGYHGAVCVASRTMLNTGLFLWEAQQTEKQLKQWQEDGRLWSQLLAARGYETYFTGKWHVKADTAKIFTVARNVRGGMPRQTKAGYNRPLDGQPDPWDPSDPKFGGFWQGGKHWSEVVGDDASDYLGLAAKSDAPFFMYIAFNAPHDPRQAPREYVDMYPPGKIALPGPFLSEYPHKDKIGCGPGLRDEKLAPFPRTPNSVRVNRGEYYAIITHMDAQIGRVLAALEATGKADNTYIVFTADHGLACGHHGLMGKQNMYDHSVRVPFMIVGPDIAADVRDPTPIYLQDIMPTTLELAGAPVPGHVKFHSLLPLLRGEGKPPYDAIYGAYTHQQRMVTRGGWKLIHYPNVPVSRLYHVAEDPLEQRDLADKHSGKVKALMEELHAWQARVADPILERR